MSQLETCLPAIIGHRGACGHAPENTLASVRAAAALGVKWVEFDVKLSADDQMIILHDDSLERTTNGSGAAAERRLADIQALDAGSWFDAAFRGERVPTLDDYISLLRDLGLGAVVEIKPTPGREVETGQRVAAHLAAHWPGDLPAPLLCSFKPASLAAARAAAPALERAMLLSSPGDDWHRIAEQVGACAVHCNHLNLSKIRAVEIIQAGFALRCYTVNQGPRAAALFDWGVDGVITDYPDRMPTRPAT
ncbi:MAG: glycerophosphodiester phosphodiesterase [Alphaproteobacteria bacterium]|jgi:glycerophosphoryl diester phosphodiesterase|nr:glycerophosphodiester phosphodiesterase [Alphaproteobacteria bacterium]MDP6831930.1 glycerophosphodiester phosphodiesterase [Alphaproteobacteria bacterium]MDP6873819.1 glycerophosphodiester phosphodiesterase [Alphaproteobacteria bacterium]